MVVVACSVLGRLRAQIRGYCRACRIVVVEHGVYRFAGLA
jgi:hypothetical protein